MNEFYEFLTNSNAGRLAGILIVFLIALHIIMLTIVGVVKHISKIFVKPKCEKEAKNK